MITNLNEFLLELEKLDLVGNITNVSGITLTIIAINMTIIGLTSLANTKNVMGVDYGDYLLKKHKLLNIRLYNILIFFAMLNVFCLGLMFLDNSWAILLNITLSLGSLAFAIFYFFTYIIVENVKVEENIIHDEIRGMYVESLKTKHTPMDMKVKMNAGSSTKKKMSNCVSEYFSSYDSNRLELFIRAFGRKSFIYDLKDEDNKCEHKKPENKQYVYRVGEVDNDVKEISFEFFQMYRYSTMQDKWILEILEEFSGTTENFEIIRVYNVARVAEQLVLFGDSHYLLKYKFFQNYFKYVVSAFKNYKSIDDCCKKDIDDVEMLMWDNLSKFITRCLKTDDNDIYKRYLSELEELINEDNMPWENDRKRHIIEKLCAGKME